MSIYQDARDRTNQHLNDETRRLLDPTRPNRGRKRLFDESAIGGATEPRRKVRRKQTRQATAEHQVVCFLFTSVTFVHMDL